MAQQTQVTQVEDNKMDTQIFDNQAEAPLPQEFLGPTQTPSQMDWGEGIDAVVYPGEIPGREIRFSGEIVDTHAPAHVAKQWKRNPDGSCSLARIAYHVPGYGWRAAWLVCAGVLAGVVAERLSAARDKGVILAGRLQKAKSDSGSEYWTLL